MDGDVGRDIHSAGSAVRDIGAAVDDHEPAAAIGADGSRSHAGLGLNIAVPGIQRAAAGDMQTARRALGGVDVGALDIGYAVAVREHARAAGRDGLDIDVIDIHLAVGDEQGRAYAVEAGLVAAGAAAAVCEGGVRNMGGRALVYMDDVLVAVDGFHVYTVKILVAGDVDHGIVGIGLAGTAAAGHAHAPGRLAGGLAGSEGAQAENHAQRNDKRKKLGCFFHVSSSKSKIRDFSLFRSQYIVPPISRQAIR